MVQLSAEDPTAAEWSKWALACLVKSSPRAQLEMQALVAQDVVQSNVLEGLGVKISLDRRYNKVNITHINGC